LISPAPLWSATALPAQAQRGRRIWLFDLDNTLHDASAAVFGQLKSSMTDYIQEHLAVCRADAEMLRIRYWQRYGATLLGLMRHHGVSSAHFLHQTHRLPGLEHRVRAPRADREALRKLVGRRVILTNAPRAYAFRVLAALDLLHLFDAIICIEDMSMFGHLRPKPDSRMLRMVLRRLRVRAADTVLVEDTLEHQKSARRVGMKTVWMQGFLRGAAASGESTSPRLNRRPSYVDRRIFRLRDL
jgi:putative hydrolase of the HAD superfamily